MAKLSNTFQAEEAYQKALEIKPNYVRAWSNLGLLYNQEGNFEDAARMLLNALSLNPKAKHIWEYF